MNITKSLLYTSQRKVQNTSSLSIQKNAKPNSGQLIISLVEY